MFKAAKSAEETCYKATAYIRKAFICKYCSSTEQNNCQQCVQLPQNVPMHIAALSLQYQKHTKYLSTGLKVKSLKDCKALHRTIARWVLK